MTGSTGADKESQRCRYRSREASPLAAGKKLRGLVFRRPRSLRKSLFFVECFPETDCLSAGNAITERDNYMNIDWSVANQASEEYSDQFSSRRLWTAVLLQALDDWKSSNMRLKTNAERFFFQSSADFSNVCRSAGLAPESVLSRLRRMSALARQQPTFPGLAGCPTRKLSVPMTPVWRSGL